jgi:hypothetical protein
VSSLGRVCFGNDFPGKRSPALAKSIYLGVIILYSLNVAGGLEFLGQESSLVAVFLSAVSVLGSTKMGSYILTELYHAWICRRRLGAKVSFVFGSAELS